MSSSIDQRIVSMKFDNAQFESGAKQSINTLDKLKNSLDVDKSANSLKNLNSNLNNFSVANIEHGLSNLGRGFSVLEVAAITAISNITTSLMNKLGSAISNTLGLIYSGGLRRATNLEQARFSMQGLLYDTDEAGKQILNYGITVEDVMSTNGPVQTAVRGTAFGLDEAAKAASNFIASGVTDLGELEEVLKSISGTAAQTGGSYEEIAHIYQRIAGNNRVYAIDLQSFAARGVNAAAALAKSLGKTEVEVREMVSAGKIDLKIFSKAMYDAFGENAFRANETYSGSLSNLKAALSRLGAKFESKKLENMRDIFNALRPTVDSLSAALDPLITMVTDLSTAVSQFAIGKIDKIKEFFDVLTSESNKKFDILEDFDKLTEGMSKAEKIAFKKQIEEEIRGPIGRLKQTFENTLESLKNFGSGFATFFKKISDIIKLYGSPFENLDLTKGLETISEKLLEISNSFKNFIENSILVQRIVNTIGVSFRALKAIVEIGIDVFKNFGSFLSGLRPIFSNIASAVVRIAFTFAGFIGDLANLVKTSGIVTLFFERLSDIFSEVGVVVSYLLEKLGLMGLAIDSSSPLVKALNFLYKAFEYVLNILVDLLSSSDRFKGFGSTITGALDKILEVLSPVGEGFDRLKEKIKGFFKSISSGDELSETGSSIHNFLNKIFGGEGDFSLIEKATGILEKFLDLIGRVVKKISETFSFADIFKVGLLTKLGFGASGLAIIFKELESIYQLMAGFFGRVANFKALQVRELALTLLILVGAIAILSMIDTVKLIGALGAFEILLLSIESFLESISELDVGLFKAIGISRLANMLVPLGVAILAFAVAMRIVASLQPQQIIQGLAVVGVLILALMTFLETVSKLKPEKNIKVAGTLIALAIAVNLLVLAVKKFGETDVETLMKGLTSVGLLLTGLMIFTKFSNADKMGFSSGAGILLLATALLVLTNVVKSLGEMNPDKLTQGLGAIGFALLGIIVFINALEETKPISAAAGLLIAAAALVILANALSRLTGFDSEALSVSMLMLLSTLGGIMLVLMILDKTVSLGTAVGLLLVATAVATLAEAFLVLALVPADKLAVGLLAILAGVVGLGAAAWLLEPVAGVMIVISGAMAIFGVGLLALATAMAIMTPIMVIFSESLVISLKTLLSGIISMKQQIISAMIVIMTAIVESIIATAPKMKDAFVVVIQMILQAFVELFDVIVQSIVDLLTIIATALVEAIPILADAALQIIFGILTVIMENMFEFVVLGITIVTEFINGIAEALPELIDAGFNLIISFIEGLATAIDENAERLGEAAWHLIKALVMGLVNGGKGFFKEPIAMIKDLGGKILNKLGEFFNIKNAREKAGALINGLKDGIGNRISSVIGKVRELGSKAIAKLKEFVSFEKLKEVGKNIINGLKDGISSLASTAVNKIKEVGQNLLNGFKNFLGIQSPSTKFKDAGGNIIEGVNEGLSDDRKPLNTISSFANNLLTKFKGLFSKDKGTELGSSMISGVSTGLSGGSTGSVVSSIIEKIKKQFDKRSEFEDIGRNLMNGLTLGIEKGTPKVVTQSGHTANSVVKRVEAEMEIKSPSRVFRRIGEYCMDGLAIGLGETRNVEKNVDKLKDVLTDGLESKISDVDTTPTITPILDLSEVQNGMTTIDGLIGRNQMLGSISANINGSENQILSAINALTNRLNQKMDDSLTSEEIYDAIREGAANAQFTVLLNGKSITSVVNSRNSDLLDSGLGFI